MQTKYAGYMGRVMMVDLSTETVSESPWTDEQRELYLGGKIMAARILCDHLTGRETAFSEENWVVISTGPLTGKKKFGKLCIGPAGENLVKYADIVSDERSAGRTGLGAVLGWKGLKAITATGSKIIPVCDKEKTTQWCKKWFAYLQSHPLTGSQLPKVGTAGLVSSMQMCGLLRIESGIKEKQFEAATVKDVLEQLTSCGIDRRDLNGCVILVNGNSANKRSKLQDGDTVVLMSPVAGG